MSAFFTQHVDDVHAAAVHRDHRRDARLVLLGEPDPELESVGLRDLVVEERAEAAAVDAPHDLTDEVPVGHRVVAVRDAGLPQRQLHLERADDRVPRQCLGARELGVDGGQPRLVGEQPLHRDVLLAGLPELGPVLHHRRVDVEQAALGEQVRADRSGALGAGEDDLQRVVVVRRAGVVARPAPDVDDLPAVDVERVARALFAVLDEVVGEGVAHALVPGLDGPIDLDAHGGER
jgi:hypothetical protein